MATLKTTGQTRRVFTDAQNAALREALKDMKARKGLSQAGIGVVLGIKQQNVGRVLNSTTDGFAWATATRLVRALGYASPETFFRAKGVALVEDEPTARSA